MRTRRAADDDTVRPTRPPGAARRIDSAFGVFASGQTIGGRWRLEGLVRWSATGSLWLARAHDADRRVLFKLVHPHLSKERRRTALYASTARAVVGIRHPALLGIFDVKVADGQVLVVAQSLEGSALRPDASLQAAGLLQVSRGVAGALAALHAEGVAHLDVRPSKILLTNSGVRLIDLGSGRVRAVMRNRELRDARVAFQAPEQIVARDHGETADIYSLGLTIWTVAGGDLQRMGANPTAQVGYRMTNNVPPLDATSGPLPPNSADSCNPAESSTPSRTDLAARTPPRGGQHDEGAP